MSKQKKSITLYRNSSLENRLEQALIPNRGIRFEVAGSSRWSPRLICNQKNSRLFYFAPWKARLARFSFNWRDPSPENVKSSCFPRHKTRLWDAINRE